MNEDAASPAPPTIVPARSRFPFFAVGGARVSGSKTGAEEDPACVELDAAPARTHSSPRFLLRTMVDAGGAAGVMVVVQG